MNFRELLIRAKAGDKAALSQIIDMYKPLLIKESRLNGRFDEDLFQEVCITLLRCVEMFKL